MKKLPLLLLLLAGSLCLLHSCGKTSKPADTPAKVVIAYVTSWSKVMPDPSLVTHINYAFGHVTDSFNGVSTTKNAYDRLLH